jgi:hypothetical protein
MKMEFNEILFLVGASGCAFDHWVSGLLVCVVATVFAMAKDKAKAQRAIDA